MMKMRKHLFILGFILFVFLVVLHIIIDLNKLNQNNHYSRQLKNHDDSADCVLENFNIYKIFSIEPISLWEYFVDGKRTEMIFGSIRYENVMENGNLISFSFPENSDTPFFVIANTSDTLVIWYKHSELNVISVENKLMNRPVVLKQMEYGGPLEYNVPDFLCH